MEELQDRLGYHYQDPSLLQIAITHSSYVNEHRDEELECNERLEFLGDSILGMVVADYLFHTYPDMPEGELTRIRSSLVCETALYQVAYELHLGDYLLLGHGETLTGGRTRPSILADATEAVLASVYLDGGLEAVQEVICRLVIGTEPITGRNEDFKTALQEMVQSKSGRCLTYKLVQESGPDHDKIFTICAKLNGKVVGTGMGRSKKAAEQSAAEDALMNLKKKQK